MGMAMFTSLAIGAPLGTALYGLGGFEAIALATSITPLATLGLVAGLAPAPQRGSARSSFVRVAHAVWLPGLGAALSSIGYGAILAFGSLLFVERGWSPVWLVFTAYAAALITARMLLGHLPDKLGGAKIAIVFVLVEAAGLILIWAAPRPAVAAAGAVLTGVGYSLVYPGLGVEALRRVSPENRGLAMGLYTACLDVALGFGSPALGVLAAWTGVGSAFLASGLVVLASILVALRLLR
jgi:predicted MFS family arabinose efflux permease